MTHLLTPTPAPNSRRHLIPRATWKLALNLVFAAGPLTFLAAGPAFAAQPVAQDSTVWAYSRYEVETAPGEFEYQIPIDLLAFASDADGDPLQFTIVACAVPTGAGTVANLGAGLVLFQIGVSELAALESGAEFCFTASDGTGGSATATVTVNNLESLPVPVTSAEDFFDVPVDRPSTLPVLDNDQGVDSIIAFTQGTRGVVTLDGTGTALVFTPAPGFAPGETDTFTYTPAGPGGEGQPTPVTVTGVAPPQPIDPVLQVLQNWDDVVVPEGSNVPFLEPVPVGDPDSLRFKLHNPTEEDIEITNAASAVTGECFSVIEAIPDIVPPASTLDPTALPPGFRVRVQCPTSGLKTATVTLETQSASGTLYRAFTFTVTAEVVAGPTPLVVRQGWDGAVILDGAVLDYPNDAVFEYPTSFLVEVENPTTERIDIPNAASAISGAGFWPVLPGAPVPDSIEPGATAQFRVRLLWDAPQTVTGTVTLESVSASGNIYEPFSFDVVATLVIPEVGVFRGWPGADPTALVDGDVVQLPTIAAAGDSTHSVAFHIRNTGLEGTVAVKNPDATLAQGDCFVVKPGGFPDELVPVGSFTPFRVWWGASCGPGTYTAEVDVSTNAYTDYLDPFFQSHIISFTIVGEVASLPELTCEPADARVVAGETATFTVCTVDTGETFTYAWFKDGQPIPGSGPTLTLSAVTDADEGAYHVDVTSDLGTVSSRAATLTVVNKPVVSKPANQTVSVGGTATFSVTVSSPVEDGPFNYVWQELPPGAATFQTIPGETADTLTVTGVTVAMDGTFYRCLVSNDAGQTNPGRGKLTVVDPPVITQQPQSQRVVAGSDVSFSVTATGSPAPTYMWRKDGVTNGVTTPTLSLSAVTDSDEGLYKVRVSNSEGWVDSQGATLTVVNKPVVSRPANRSAPIGGSATFSVTVSSPAEDGPFTYKWQQLPPGAASFQTITGATSSSLTVSNITLAMDGTKYRCLVSNDAGQTNSLPGTLTVSTADVQVTRAWDGIAVGEGTTFDFGTAERSIAKSYRFKITNTGQASLTISNPTAFVSGTCWSQIENAATTVNPGGVTYFRVRLLCGSTGTKNGTITINSNDPSSPYRFYVRGTVVASNVTVYRAWNGVLQSEGTTFPFPDTLQGTSDSRRFRITNTGQATLTITNPTSLVSGTCWSQIENAASTVAPGASTYFRVRLLCNTTGTKTGTITIYSNDPTSPYRFYVQGTVTAPDPGNVTVYRAWNGVLQGEGTTFPFPDTTTGTAVSRRFQITNTGTGTLTITNPTSFVSGTCWSQIENAASSVAPGASTYFRVRLLCNTTGTKTGTITIYSNDTSSPYRFYVQGTVN